MMEEYAVVAVSSSTAAKKSRQDRDFSFVIPQPHFESDSTCGP